MKNLTLFFVALLTLPTFSAMGQTKGEAWFYAVDHSNKIMYLTELQNVVVIDNHNNPDAWRNGFVELMGWQNRVPDTYFVSFNWMSTNHAKWYSSEKESREYKISAFKKKGYTLKYISMPEPKNPPQKKYNTSGQ